MQCAKFEQRLQQLLDDRKNVEQDEMLRGHARDCDACGKVLHAQSRLFAGLRLHPLPQPLCPKEMGHRVLDQMRIDRRRRSNRRYMMVALATAATIMIALLPFAGDRVRFRPKDGRSGGGLALVTPAPRQIAVRTLTAQESEDLRVLMHQLMVRLSEHRFGIFEPVDELASGIRPLAVTFNLALDTLWRTLPGYSERQPVEPQAQYHGVRPPIS
ncbi:MAG: hypothetical protein O3C40_07265 [Planctomycetota bacterium]|nr:hypothetical protein [Planctomycetota bacterium]